MSRHLLACLHPPASSSWCRIAAPHQIGRYHWLIPQPKLAPFPTNDWEVIPVIWTTLLTWPGKVLLRTGNHIGEFSPQMQHIMLALPIKGSYLLLADAVLKSTLPAFCLERMFSKHGFHDLADCVYIDPILVISCSSMQATKMLTTCRIRTWKSAG